MNGIRGHLAAALLLLAVQPLAASETEAIRGKLRRALPQAQIGDIAPSAVSGIYEVEIAPGQIIYVTADGGHFFFGDLYSVRADGLLNLAEQRREAERKALLAEVPRRDMIVFSPAGGTRSRVTVFTDVDCFYCQKFHREVPAMNAMGIEVRYLAYPRSGVGSESYRKIASAWCADDPNAAITRLKNQQEIPENVCPGNPVAEQLALGARVGVQGTPALVLQEGRMLPGYVSAEELAGHIGLAD